MFKLFGKKQEPQEEVREAALSRHPKAAALGAQFWQEEFDILAVTGANGFGGGEEDVGEEYRTVTLPLTAWREDDGPIHREDTGLVALADDKLLTYLRRLAPPDSIIQARVRQGMGDNRFLLVGLPGPVMDPELKAILDEQTQEVSVYVAELGTFVLNRTVNWFQADVDWQGQSIQLVYDQGPEEEMGKAQETARTLMSAQSDWDGRVRSYAAEQLPLQNKELEDGMRSLSPEELAGRLEPESVQVWADGSFEFWFHDADYQWEHDLRVRGTLEGGPNCVQLEG